MNKLKAYLVKHHGLDAAATDEQAKTLLGDLIAKGVLTPERCVEIQTKSDTPEVGGKIREMITEEVGKQIAPVTQGLGELTTLVKGLVPAAAAQNPAENPGTQPDGGLSVKQETLIGKTLAMVNGAVALTGGTAPEQKSGQQGPRDAMIAGQGTGVGETGSPRVKSAAEQYDSTRKGAIYSDSRNLFLAKAWSGQPVINGDPSTGMSREMNHPSQLDKAIAGVWFKLAVGAACRNMGRPIPKSHMLTEHDQQLIDYALHELPFVGLIDYNHHTDQAKHAVHNRKLFDYERKSLLDDVTSGGLEAAPIAFDDAVILTPLLHGELFPLVNLVNVARGRRIEAFSIGNPTFTWGISEGTPIGLFNTDSFIAAFDTTIFNATGAMSIGQDFESDSPSNIGQIVINNYGEAARNTLDYVVAVGDGTSQPQGVVNSSITGVSSDNGTGGPPTYGDDLNLMFGVSKAFRNQADRNRLVYISNDTTYKRSRNIKVDPATPSTDQRPLYGVENVDNYQTLGRPHKIQNDISNNDKAFVNLGRYRMYRRLGMQVAIERGGKQLVLANEELIVVRMRFGGQMELAGAGAIMEDCQN